jgi:hypothetical protein
MGTPSIQSMLGVVKRQRVEGAIRCPRYLLGATGEGARLLRRAPSDPLPLRELIFLREDEDIRAWLLANDGKHPLDLMVLEPRLGEGEGRDQTPAPAHGRYPFFDRKVWDRCGRAGDIGGAMSEEEEVAEVEEEEEDSGGGAITIDVSFQP